MSGKREKARHAGGFILANIVVIFLIVVCGFWWSTQWIAAMLGYQPELGPPLFHIMGYRVYAPFSYIPWALNYNGYAPDLFTKAMLPIFGASFCSILAAICLSVWRSRLVIAATTYGSARWATKREIKNSGMIDNDAGGVVVGVTDDGHYITHDGPEHVKVIAPSRSGKGVGIVIPTLLNWKHSVIVNDIKRELWKETAGYRSKFSYCLAFDPANKATARFNPLYEVRKGDYEVKDVQNITDMIVDPDGKGKPDHWSKEADAYLVAVILHVLYAEKNKTLQGVYNFINHPDRSLDMTLQIMMRTKHLDGKDVHPIVAMGARGMMNKSANEKSGVQSSAKSFLILFTDPIVAAATSGSDFTISDLQRLKHPVSLYLIFPPSDIDRLRPLFRLILNQICKRLTEEMNPENNHRLLLLMDEFPSLGKLPFFSTALGYFAGYGIKSMMISQNYNQLWEIYGKNNTIVESCHMRVYFAPNTEESAEPISKALGMKTEIHQQRNYAGHRLSPWLGHVMVSDQESARALLTPSEVMALPARDEIIMVAGLMPIYARKIKYYEDNSFLPRTSIHMPAPVIKDGPYPFRCPEKENVWLLLPIWEVKIEPASDTSTSETTDDSTDTGRNDWRDELELFNDEQEQAKHNPKIKEKDITTQQRNDFLEHQIDHNNIDMETF